MTVNAGTSRLRRGLFQRQTQAHWKQLLRRRSTIALVVGMSVWLLVFSRLFYLQVLKAAEYKKIAVRQHQLHIVLEAKRGIIYDRQGKELVVNLPAESFFAVPESVKDVDQVARAFEGSSGYGISQIKQNLTTRKSFVWLKRDVEKEESERIKQKKLEGVWARTETKRYYLYGDLCKELLGFTDIDNRGLAGIEYQYDQSLRGTPGEAMFQRDGHQNYYQITEYPIQKPADGKNLVLTIDMDLQSVVEQELNKGIEVTGADGGYAIFMCPRTGEILAMAYFGKDEGLPVKNRTINDCFEPGSTFKIITAAAALEENVLKPEDRVFAENGQYRLGKHIIHDVHPQGWLTFKECVVYSSNIALGKIALKVGKDRLHRYARQFGIGQKTGIDLPGEASGFLPSAKAKWSDIALANIGFGQGVSLTGLQIACAYSAVVNGGVLMKPYVVKAILDAGGDTVESFGPTPVRRAISQPTAGLLVDFMKGVVSIGSGKKAQIEGLEIGGKTGTAQKAKPGGRGYEENKYMASFVGFFPADDPQMVGLITLDSPKNVHLGGSTAAPIFKNATQRIVSMTGESILTSAAKNALSTTTAVETFPASLEEKHPRQEQRLAHRLAEPESTFAGGNLIPDVRGKTAREAIRIFALRDLRFQVKGSGIVTSQSPEPDSVVNKDSVCVVIQCQPQ
ncbi:MAG: penicillin-binding protein [Candidatus Zixiibacteriota bacterium]